MNKTAITSALMNTAIVSAQSKKDQSEVFVIDNPRRVLQRGITVTSSPPLVEVIDSWWAKGKPRKPNRGFRIGSYKFKSK